MARIGVSEAAKALEKNERTVRRWRDQGAPFDRDGRVDLAELRAWLEQRARKGAGRPPEVDRLTATASSAAAPATAGVVAAFDEADADLLAAIASGDAAALRQASARPDLSSEFVKRLALVGRTRRELAEAERREAENRRLAGELVPVEDVKRLWAWQIEVVKTAFDALPGKLAPLAAGKTEAEVYRLLDNELRDTLEAFATATPIPKHPRSR